MRYLTTDHSVLIQGFSESGVTDMDAPYPSTRPDSTAHYGYDSDSDLEDEAAEASLTEAEESEVSRALQYYPLSHGFRGLT